MYKDKVIKRSVVNFMQIVTDLRLARFQFLHCKESQKHFFQFKVYFPHLTRSFQCLSLDTIIPVIMTARTEQPSANLAPQNASTFFKTKMCQGTYKLFRY